MGQRSFGRVDGQLLVHTHTHTCTSISALQDRHNTACSPACGIGAASKRLGRKPLCGTGPSPVFCLLLADVKTPCALRFAGGEASGGAGAASKNRGTRLSASRNPTLTPVAFMNIPRQFGHPNFSCASVHAPSAHADDYACPTRTRRRKGRRIPECL